MVSIVTEQSLGIYFFPYGKSMWIGRMIIACSKLYELDYELYKKMEIELQAILFQLTSQNKSRVMLFASK